ncbi:AGAP004996-PA-like protein [Anopheles sinensis]|uniref:AGAP004996-PA-like protein n=1 Tax=Anopheles sinensis TaxID=74873 RepID=A0A084WDV8_ANOSI|nr:AGAP004996-PA-like protein [Anopheles sinensis]
MRTFFLVLTLALALIETLANGTAATGKSINDQLSLASANSIRELTVNQQSLMSKTTESILEGRQGEPEGDIINTSCDDPRITETGTYLVQDSFDVPTKLICVLEFGPGAYTVIQNRQDGSTDFYRGYNDYKAGFGEFDGGDYWLGLDRIHNITASGDYELFVLLEDFEKNVSFARYDSFSIGSSSDFYPILKLEGFSGPAGNSFDVVGGVLFSTYDLDLDNSEINCAVNNRGGWWYTECGDSNLNGLYLKGLTGGTTGMSWRTFRGPNYSLKKSRMMVKRKGPLKPSSTLQPDPTDGPVTEPATTLPPTDTTASVTD